jgi:hypothetical protein
MEEEAIEALNAIADALDVPRNRFGKLEVDSIKGDAIKELARRYKVGGCLDVAEQCMKVARAILLKNAQEKDGQYEESNI